ncbi:hypothetical protein TURU_109773 [Turdus rufiventris]|nr:hypothetical protein TURU_109773 [Turdus rufiventris]
MTCLQQQDAKDIKESDEVSDGQGHLKKISHIDTDPSVLAKLRKVSEYDARLFSGVPSNRTRKTETDAQEVPPEHEEELLYCEDEHGLEQTDQRGCEISSLEIFKNYLHEILCHVLQEDSALAGRLFNASQLSLGMDMRRVLLDGQWDAGTFVPVSPNSLTQCH